MAYNVYLKLKIGGNEIKGESQITSLNRKDTIECFSFTQSVDSGREVGAGSPSSQRRHTPIVVLKRTDRASPLLYQALCQNKVVDSGEFRFFRAKPDGSGEEENFFTVTIEKGYVSGMKQVVPDTTDKENEHLTPIDEVRFVFSKITWLFADGGVTYTDSWSGEK